MLLTAAFLAITILLSGCTEEPFPKIGKSPPSITCNDINGEYIRLDQLKGNVVVIYFWSSSCCGERVKQLEPWFGLNKHKGLSVLAVNVGNDDDRVRTFVKKNGLTFTMLTDEYGMISRRYGVVGFPTIFILDGKGVVRKKILGEIEASQLFKLATQLL